MKIAIISNLSDPETTIIIGQYFNSLEVDVLDITQTLDKIKDKYFFFIFLLCSDENWQKEIILDRGFLKVAEDKLCFILFDGYGLDKKYSDFPKCECDSYPVFQHEFTDTLDFIKKEYIFSVVHQEKIRLNNYGIELSYIKSSNFANIIEANRVKIYIPESNGDKRPFYHSTNIELTCLLTISEFENYCFIKDYDAVWSAKDKEIECELDVPVHNFAKIFAQDNVNEADELHFSYNDMKVEISTMSYELSVLLSKEGEDWESFYSLKIKNIETKSKFVKKLLLRVANSLFFHISSILGVGLTLKSNTNEYIERFLISEHMNKSIQRPHLYRKLKLQYDDEPMVLFLEAISNNYKPLSKFLSYYQVLEYYFPKYQKKYQINGIKPFIECNQHNAVQDNDIMELIRGVTKFTKNKYSEREQLKFILQDLLSTEIINDFFNDNEQRKIFFNNNKTGKFIDANISSTHNKEQAITEISKRIYEIRNSIVHSKGTQKVIFPYSEEVKLLVYDIELIEYIAKLLLDKNAKEFTLNKF